MISWNLYINPVYNLTWQKDFYICIVFAACDLAILMGFLNVLSFCLLR